MSQLIKTEQLLGKSAVVVGDKYANLVLETLGKVYIKSGNNFKLLNDLFKLLDQINASTDNDTKDSAIIIELGLSIKDIDYPGEGVFIFDTNTQILYISMLGRYIALINAKDFTNDKYVRKEGDTITGNLTINGYLNMATFDTAPFIINSNKLVKNLNSEYLNGYSYRLFAKIAENETITGLWCFKNICTADDKWTFKDNVFLKKHVITEGSFSTPVFSSGFAGTGWMLDGATNTLTIDNLIVRKAMMVYEMVVNQIRATNGSLWVTNASVCETASKLKFISIIDQLFDVDDPGTENSTVRDVSIVKSNEYFVPIDVYVYDDAQESYINNITETIDGKNLSTNVDFGETTKFHKFKYLYKITDKLVLINKVKLNGIKDLLNVDDVQTKYNDCISVIDIDEESVNRNSLFVAYIESPTHGDPLAVDIYTYYKYFGCKYFNTVEGVEEFVPNYWMITFKDDSRPVFEVGDILKCQKMNDKGVIKYYDAVVFKKFTTRTYLIQVAYSIFDIYTEVSYDENGNLVLELRYNESLYKRGSEDDEGHLGQPLEGDDIVQVGNIQDKNRLGAVYITSSDDLAPYIKVVGEINRPDYSVLYKKPIYVTYPHIGADGKRRNYYVSEVPSNILLGKFRVDETTNNIIPALPSDSLGSLIDGYTVYNLYGYELFTSKCVHLKDSLGNYIYEYINSTKVRLGKLDGEYNYILGKNQPYGYGLYSDNVFLTGEFYLNNGKSIASFADDIALLSGEILHIDIDQLKLEVTASVENIIENKFKSTTDDEEGNEIPAGFAGLFTFDYTDITGDGALDGKKGLAVLGDSIVFYTSKDGKFDFNDPTALIQNKKINADLIDVEKLEFDKLIGMCQYDPVIIESIQFHDNSDLDNIILGTIIGTAEVIPIVVGGFTQGNYIKKRTLYLEDFYIETRGGTILHVKNIIEDLLPTWIYEKIEDPLSITIHSIPNVGDDINTETSWNDVRLVSQNTNIYVKIIYGQTSKEYDIISVNKNKFGETILYYPDGSVLNAKIVSQSTDRSSITGCVEYWFKQGAITELQLLLGDDYIVNNYVEDLTNETYKNGLIKRINYFTFNYIFKIDWRSVVTKANTLDGWNILLGEEHTSLNSVYNRLKDLSEAARKQLGNYATEYSITISSIIENIGQVASSNTTVGSFSGNAVIKWIDGSTTDLAGKWFKYSINVEKTISNYLDTINGNPLDKKDSFEELMVNEGLHMIDYVYINDNTGSFVVEYFNTNNEIYDSLYFTIKYGEYNGPYEVTTT